MINRCIGCYYHDSKENVCTYGSPIFIDDVCTNYQDSEFVKQIQADVIDGIETRLEEDLAMVLPRDKVKYMMYKVHTVLEQLKEQKNES